MKNPLFYIFGLIFLEVLLILLLPKTALADLQLSKQETNFLLNAVQKVLIDEWINLTALPDFSEPEKQVALFIIRNAIQKKELDYFFKEIPKETLKSAIKIAGFLLTHQEAKAILEKLEKESVKRAVEMGMDWLLQKEIKIAKGHFDYSFTSYLGNLQKPTLHYVLAYQGLGNQYGEVAIEFYSPEFIEPQESTGNVLWLNAAPWDFSTWRAAGNTELPSFIIRIKGQVKQGITGGFIWQKTDFIEVTFSEPVPEFTEEAEGFEIPFLSDYIEEWQQKFEKIKILAEKLAESLQPLKQGTKNLGSDLKNKTNNALEQVKSTLLRFFSLGGASITELAQIEELSEAEEKIEKGITGLENLGEALSQPESQLVENGSPLIREEGETREGKPELSLESIQEQLDDIAEMADTISQGVAELITQTKGLEKLAFEAEKNSAEKLDQEPDEQEKTEEEGETEELRKEEEFQQEKAGKEEIILCQIPEAGAGLSASHRVIINEVGWMGTSVSSNDEWLELKNISGTAINLANWQLLDKDGQIKIVFKNKDIILANGFYLLERTNDNSVPGAGADLIFTGALNNNEETLYLFNESCQLQDEVLASPNWPAGDNISKRTMERRQDLGWQTSSSIEGTPKRENSSGYVETPVYAGGSGGGGTPPPPSYPKILISEIQISPIDQRFIELYNPNNSEVNLTGWYLQRKTEIGTTWSSLVSSTRFEGKTIQPKSYFLIARTSALNSDILLEDLTLTENNSLVLKNPNREIVDKVGWGQAQEYETATTTNPETGKSVGRKFSTTTENYIDTDNNQNDFEIQRPTPKAQNQALPNQSPTAFFIFSPSNPFLGEEILFDASSSTDSDGQIISFFWNFWDGNSTTTDQATTNYSYDRSGSFTVSLQVQDNQGAISSPATTTLNITVRPTLSVVINEIAWMGTQDSAQDEWVELYNNTEQDIDLTGWQLVSSDGSPHIIFGQDSENQKTQNPIVPSQGYYLIERTDDKTIIDVVADWYGSFGLGGLKNEGEVLELRDANGSLVDKVVCEEDEEGHCQGWFAGSLGPDYASMERADSQGPGTLPENWKNNNKFITNGSDRARNSIRGTPKIANSSFERPIFLPKSIRYDLTLTKEFSPYFVDKGVFLEEGRTLTIEPGVVIKFYPLERAYLDIHGNLEAVGTQEEKITFTSLRDDDYGGNTRREPEDFNQAGEPIAPRPGEWRNIYFRETSNSRLINTIIKYGGYCDEYCFGGNAAVIVNGGNLLLEDSRLEKNTEALWLFNTSSTVNNVEFIENSGMVVTLRIRWGAPLIKNSFFQRNQQHYTIAVENQSTARIENNRFEQNRLPIYVTTGANPIIFQNSGEQNQTNGIILSASGSPWPENTAITWKANENFPYVIMGFLSVPAGISLNIEPDVVIKVIGYINIRGGLFAEGTEEKPVVFSSFLDDEYGGDTNNSEFGAFPQPGDWQNIQIMTSATAVLRNVQIRYAGKDGVEPLLVEEGAQVEQENVIFFPSLP